MAFEFRDMQKWGNLVGRKGMSKEVISAVREFDGSYKGAMELAGRLKAIAQAAGCDEYWSEKVGRGYHKQLCKARFETRRDIGDA
jgi:hypothetical protein